MARLQRGGAPAARRPHNRAPAKPSGLAAGLTPYACAVLATAAFVLLAVFCALFTRPNEKLETLKRALGVAPLARGWSSSALPEGAAPPHALLCPTLKVLSIADPPFGLSYNNAGVPCYESAEAGVTTDSGRVFSYCYGITRAGGERVFGGGDTAAVHALLAGAPANAEPLLCAHPFCNCPYADPCAARAAVAAVAAANPDARCVRAPPHTSDGGGGGRSGGGSGGSGGGGGSWTRGDHRGGGGGGRGGGSGRHDPPRLRGPAE
jgi:hypothetical protein